MKKYIFALIILVALGTSAQAQYSCSKFYPFSEGAKSQLTLYDGKGRSSGMVEYQIMNIQDNGSSQTATMKTQLTDDKGKMVSGSEYEATCSDGVVSIDFKSLMRPEMMKAYGDMDVDTEITGTNLDLPNNLSVGQSLPDAEINIQLSISGMNMNMKTAITDRKVLAKETITTPAGTFDCFVLTQTMNLKSMAANQSRTSKQWVSEGVGVVKTEDYNRKGKLDGYSLLTSFSK
jgi:hypothetical protein